MSKKNVIGICLMTVMILWIVASMFEDAYAAHGWWAIVIVPTIICAWVAIYSFVSWLFD